MPDAQPDIEQMAVMMQSLGFELTTLEGTPDSISKAVRHSVVSIPTSVHAADSTQYVKYAYDHLLHGNRDSYSSIDTINTVPRTSVSSPQQQQRKQEQQQQHHNNTSANGLSFSHINSLVQKWGGRDALKGLSVNNVSSKFVNSATPELSFCDVYLQSPSTVSLVRKADWYICYSSSDSLFLDLLDGIRMFFVDQGMGLTEDVTVWLDVFSCPLRMQTTRRDPSFVDACLKDIPNMLLLLHPWNDPTSVKSAWNLYEIHAFARRQKNIKIAFMSEQEAALFANALVDNPLDVYNQLKLNVAAASVGTVPKLSHKQLEDIKLSVILVLEEWLIQQLDDGLEQASSHNNPNNEAEEMRWKQALGILYKEMGKPELALPLLRQVVTFHKRFYGPDDAQTFKSTVNLGTLLFEIASASSSESAAAIPDYTIPAIPSSGNGRKRGTIPSNSLEAPLLLLESVSLHASLHSQEPHYFTLFNTLGNIHLKLAPVTTNDSAVSARASAAAITAFRLALGWTTQHLPIDSLQSLTVQFNLGTAYIIAQDFVNAERVLTQCHDVCKYTLGKQDPRTIESFHSLLLVQSRRTGGSGTAEEEEEGEVVLPISEQELLDHVHRVEKVFGGEGGHVMAMEARSMMKKKYRGGSSSSSKLLEMSPTKREEMESFRKDTIKMYSGWYGSRTHVLVLREWIEWASYYAMQDDIKSARQVYQEYRNEVASGDEQVERGVALELLDFCVVFGTKLEQQQQPQDQQNQTPQPSADDNNETTTFFEKAISLISTYPQEIPSTVGLTCLDLISRHFTIHKRFEKAAASHRAKAQFQITLLQRQQQQQEQQQQPDTAVDMNDLLNSFSNAGDCFINAGQHHAAESQYLEVYHRMSTVVPPTYPLFLELLKEWAVKCESSLFHEMWIEKVDLIQGPVEAVMARYEAGCFWEQKKKLRDLEKAVWFWKEAVLMAQDSFGVDHAQTLEVKRTVGFSLKALGRYELAEEYYVSVLAVYEKAFGFGDRKTVVVSVGLAELYEQSGKLDLAEQQYLKHVHILIKKEGIQSSVTMDLVKWLAKFYIRRGRWLEAKHLCLHRVVFDGLVAKQFPLSRDPTVHDDMLNVLSHLEGGDIAGDAGEARIKQLIEVEGKQEFQKLMKK